MLGKLKVFLLCAFFLASVEHCWSRSQASQANVIHVEVAGMHNDKGQISCALYSSADGFPKKGEKAVALLHSEQENFRGTLSARTPENERATLIVARRKRQVWLTFDGAIKTTVTMTNPETTQLIGLLHEADATSRDVETDLHRPAEALRAVDADRAVPE